MNETRHLVERTGAGGSLAFRPPQPTGGRERRRTPHLRHLIIGALALLASAGRLTHALGATGAGALARPAGSKPCTGGILNSQYWKIQAGDTIIAKITGAKDARPTSGVTVPVLIQSDLSLLGNVTVAGTLTGTPGTNSATVTFSWPYSMGPSCGTSHIAYWGGPSAGFISANSALINGSKTTPAGWAIVDRACNLVRTNPLTGRCYPSLSSVQCPLQAGLVDCASGTSNYESFGFNPGGIVGGQPPYTVTASATNSVTLSPAGGYSDITLSSNDLGFSGTFPAGQTTVTITVTDAVGAAAQCSFTVTINHLTVIVADAATCAGSATTLTAQPAGGSGPYSFTWSGPGGFTATGQTVSVSAAGQYTVTVTDSNGCKGQGSGTLTVNSSPVVSLDNPTVCSTSLPATLTATITSGGTPPFTYAWSGPRGLLEVDHNFPVTTLQLCCVVTDPGVYTVTVTDANGCTASSSGTLTVNQAPAASISGQTNVSSNGGSDGSATVTVTGGTSPYTVTDGTTTQTGAGPFTFSVLAASTYHYSVTAANNCTGSTSVTITQPSLLTVSAAPGCDGSATATTSGGTGTIGYTWSNGAMGATVAAVPGQTLTVTATDANGCTASTTVKVPFPLRFSTFVQHPIFCAGGTTGVVMLPDAGTPPYTVSDGTSTQTATGEILFTEKAGSYTFTPTDGNGCTASRSVTLTDPAPLTVSTTQTNVSCDGGSNGSATALPAGGTAPYRYSWNTNPVQTSATATGLATGSYTVTVTDKNGCTASATTTFEETQLTVSITAHTNVSTSGGSDGTATAVVSGDAPPFEYSWNTSPPQTGTYSTPGVTATGLKAGTYTITVTNPYGCTATATVTITQPPPP